MEEKGYWEVNWTALFIVTACSSFIFSLVIKILDGYFSELLLIIGGITSGLSLLSWLLQVLAIQYSRKKKVSSYSTEISND
jgi:hypothetical protein